MEFLISFLEWFKSLSTIGVIIVIGIGIFVLLQIKKLIFRLISIALGIIGLAKFYLMF